MAPISNKLKYLKSPSPNKTCYTALKSGPHSHTPRYTQTQKLKPNSCLTHAPIKMRFQLPLCFTFAAMDSHSFNTLQQQVLMNGIHILLFLRKDENWWWSFLQALQQVHDLGLLLHVFHFLQTQTHSITQGPDNSTLHCAINHKLRSPFTNRSVELVSFHIFISRQKLTHFQNTV